MDNNSSVCIPRYQQIAIDIAAKVAEGQYLPGDKIYARSSLASQYGVSAETARRAICVLSDLGITDATKGSGVFIKSYENAISFVKQYKEIKTINDLKYDIVESVERQKKEFLVFDSLLTELIDKTERFRSVNTFMPYQILITAEMKYLNQSIAQMNFWHNTMATIVAIKRNDKLILSPGPYAVLTPKDMLYFVGDDTSLERVKKFLYGNE